MAWVSMCNLKRKSFHLIMSPSALGPSVIYPQPHPQANTNCCHCRKGDHIFQYASQITVSKKNMLSYILFPIVIESPETGPCTSCVSGEGDTRYDHITITLNHNVSVQFYQYTHASSEVEKGTPCRSATWNLGMFKHPSSD